MATQLLILEKEDFPLEEVVSTNSSRRHAYKRVFPKRKTAETFLERNLDAQTSNYLVFKNIHSKSNSNFKIPKKEHFNEFINALRVTNEKEFDAIYK